MTQSISHLLTTFLLLLPECCGAWGPGCLWREPLNGMDQQCMGLGAAPIGRANQAECEAYCCAHRDGNPASAKMKTADAVGAGEYCGLWQWLPPSQMPDASYKWSCFVGISGHDYACDKSQPALAHVTWAGGRGCLGPAPGNWGAIFLIAFGLSAALYVGGGSAVAAKASSSRMSLRAHPHYQRWAEIHGLCADGLSFVRGRARAPAARRSEHGRYTQAPSGAGSGVDAPKGKRSASAKHSSSKSKTAPREAAQQSHPQADLGNGASEEVQAGGSSTTASGGGRWVHVPQ